MFRQVFYNSLINIQFISDDQKLIGYKIITKIPHTMYGGSYFTLITISASSL